MLRFFSSISRTIVACWLLCAAASTINIVLVGIIGLSTVAPASAEHTSNWAVLVSTSRFWFNYRHLANVLSLYRTVKRLGIPDSQIILMLPDDMACNPRNAFPGTVFNNADRALDLYGDNIEVDYRGYEVTVENFIRLLTDRVGDEMPRSKRLLTDDRSNILVYMTGHGGNEFLKFQDAEEISAFDLADAFEQMWEKRRYHEMLFMIDTCQANTMYSKFYSPNIIATGSSEIDESSYSHHADNDVGVAVIDRYTYYNLDFLENHVRDPASKLTLGDLFDSYDEAKIHSHPGVRWDLFPGGETKGRERLVMDFFGNVQNVEVDSARPANNTLNSASEGGGGGGEKNAHGHDFSQLGDLLAAQSKRRRKSGSGKSMSSRKSKSRKGSKSGKSGSDRERSKDAASAGAGPTALAPGAQSVKIGAASTPPYPVGEAGVGAVLVEEKPSWQRQLIGASALAGCAFVWFAASWLESYRK